MKEEWIKYCPECGEKTQQKSVLFDNDHPEWGEVYICVKCGERTGWNENTL